MQSFDQSLMKWYKGDTISYESALFYSTNPSEFALRASGISSASDRSLSDIAGHGGTVPGIDPDFTP
jgi:twitching motility protein PilT